MAEQAFQVPARVVPTIQKVSVQVGMGERTNQLRTKANQSGSEGVAQSSRASHEPYRPYHPIVAGVLGARTWEDDLG